MARYAHSQRNNLDWKIRRVWLPEGLRPIGVRQMQSGSHAPNEYAGLGVLISPLFTILFGIPSPLALVPLRLAKPASWRIEAVARPWGRRGPATLLAWRVTGDRHEPQIHFVYAVPGGRRQLEQSCSFDQRAAADASFNTLVSVMAHEIVHEPGFVGGCAPHSIGGGMSATAGAN